MADERNITEFHARAKMWSLLFDGRSIKRSDPWNINGAATWDMLSGEGSLHGCRLYFQAENVNDFSLLLSPNILNTPFVADEQYPLMFWRWYPGTTNFPGVHAVASLSPGMWGSNLGGGAPSSAGENALTVIGGEPFYPETFTLQIWNKTLFYQSTTLGFVVNSVVGNVTDRLNYIVEDTNLPSSIVRTFLSLDEATKTLKFGILDSGYSLELYAGNASPRFVVAQDGTITPAMLGLERAVCVYEGVVVYEGEIVYL